MPVVPELTDRNKEKQQFHLMKMIFSFHLSRAKLGGQKGPFPWSPYLQRPCSDAGQAAGSGILKGLLKLPDN